MKEKSPAQIILKFDKPGMVSQEEQLELSEFMDPKRLTIVPFKDSHQQEHMLPVDAPVTDEFFGFRQQKPKTNMPKCDGRALHSIHTERMGFFLEAVAYLIIEKYGYNKEEYPLLCSDCHMVIASISQKAVPCVFCGQIAWAERER